jgi:hypothetical protein
MFKKLEILPFIYAFMFMDLNAQQPNADSISHTEPKLRLGGAFRMNLVSEFYEDGYSFQDTYLAFDTWRLNVKGDVAIMDVSMEYRFYPSLSSHFIHHGYIGIPVLPGFEVQLGISQVPFGLAKAASHSWWFQGPYYVGLEDDYDLGAKFNYSGIKNTLITIAYYRQAEPEGFTFGQRLRFSRDGPGRYSYDITSINDQNPSRAAASITELNHLHARIIYSFQENLNLGFSAQTGQIYNKTLQRHKYATAYAAHINADWQQWNLKCQYISYKYQAINNVGEVMDLVPLGAYGFNYFVAAQAHLYVIGVSRKIKTGWRKIEIIEPYIDYTLFNKTNASFYNSHHLVPGIFFSAGNIYTFVDMAIGKNHPWLTNSFGTGLGKGLKDAPWNARLNINIGYAF